MHINDRPPITRRTSLSSEHITGLKGHNKVQKSQVPVSTIPEYWDKGQERAFHLNGDSRNSKEINKTSHERNDYSLGVRWKIPYESSQDSNLSLPSYYPHNKYESDLSQKVNSKTNESFIKRSSSKSDFNDLNKIKEGLVKEKDNISYDENIVLAKNNFLYKTDYKNKDKGKKPRTIRDGSSFTSSFFNRKPSSLPNVQAACIIYDSDSTLSDYYPKFCAQDISKEEGYEENTARVISIDVPDERKQSTGSSNSESNSIRDKINPRGNSKEKFENSSSKGKKFNQSSGSESSKEEQSKAVENDEEKSKKQKEEDIIKSHSNKTYIKVSGSEDLYSAIDKSEADEDYKTIVSVGDASEESNQVELTQEIKKHSHNYFKEFLESQKGSARPLQNFITKKISRAFGENKRRSRSAGNLTENSYHSLPDITAGKNLERCERIDQKLRKFDGNLKVQKGELENYSTNRFIVNIGRHFDVTAQSNIPVDFEVKISKISRSDRRNAGGKQKSPEKQKNSDEENFLDAVKNLKNTLSILDENHNETKPSIIGVTTKDNVNLINVNPEKKNYTNFEAFNSQQDSLNSSVAENQDNLIEEVDANVMDTAVKKEYMEKLGSMRRYWSEITNSNENQTFEENEEEKNIKVDEVKKKFESDGGESENKTQSIVRTNKQLFEKKPTGACGVFKNPFFDTEGKGTFKNHRPLAKSKSSTGEQEFDHVRYRIVKSDLFQKKIFANCEKESQFDDLMRYLKDYSFQELLVDNNIVIIEPIRTSVPFNGSKPTKTIKNITQLLHTKKPLRQENESSSIKRHFFYHPVRVNREVNDEELPNPDTVKQVRQFFERRVQRSQSSDQLHSMSGCRYPTVDPDKDVCSGTGSNSSNYSEFGSNENVFDSFTSNSCCDQYVSEDILEKIREYGTSITYYGGRITNEQKGECFAITKAIMEEIQKGRRNSECNCKKNEETRNKHVNYHKANGNINEANNKDLFQGVKFKLLKSNSCSSRLELVGTKNVSEYRNKFLQKEKEMLNMRRNCDLDKAVNESESVAAANLNNVNKNKLGGEINLEVNRGDRDKTNEYVRDLQDKVNNASPKIIGEEMKNQESKERCEINDEKVDKMTFRYQKAKINYDYHNYDKVISKPVNTDDMVFEEYEVA